MKRGLVAIFVICLTILPLAVFGCKSKMEKIGDEQKTETTEATVPTEDVVVTQTPVDEPATQMVIPPTASVPPSQEAIKTSYTDQLARNKDIQIALKAAKFYTGNIDGKIGPKTKKAIIEFQKAKGLKPDGKVGPKTWAELEKYLAAR